MKVISSSSHHVFLSLSSTTPSSPSLQTSHQNVHQILTASSSIFHRLVSRSGRAHATRPQPPLPWVTYLSSAQTSSPSRWYQSEPTDRPRHRWYQRPNLACMTPSINPSAQLLSNSLRQQQTILVQIWGREGRKEGSYIKDYVWFGRKHPVYRFSLAAIYSCLTFFWQMYLLYVALDKSVC
jgi:hypothetical protein